MYIDIRIYIYISYKHTNDQTRNLLGTDNSHPIVARMKLVSRRDPHAPNFKGAINPTRTACSGWERKAEIPPREIKRDKGGKHGLFTNLRT